MSRLQELLAEGKTFEVARFIVYTENEQKYTNFRNHRTKANKGLGTIGYLLSCLKIKADKALANKSESTEIKAEEIAKWFNQLRSAYETIGEDE